MPTPSSSTEKPARIVEAIFAIVARDGLEHATVREVAAVTGVSIGTVQHHFPTKEAMLAGAFAELVRRVRVRLESAPPTGDVSADVTAVLEQLVPLDRRRRDEARVQLAFAVRAMHDPALAATQRDVLGELHDALTRTLTPVLDGDARRARLTATGLVALADGLALDALSSGGLVSGPRLRQVLDLAVPALVGDR